MPLILRTLRKTFVMEDRATRTELWYFILFTTIVGNVLSAFADSPFMNPDRYAALPLEFIFLCKIMIFFFALWLLIAFITVTVRRLHDIDKSGWWMVLASLFMPLGWIIIVLTFCMLSGTPGENRFGSNPREDSDGVVCHKKFLAMLGSASE